jgi:hypothetical protein
MFLGGLQLVGGYSADVGQEVDFDHDDDGQFAGVEEEFECDECVELVGEGAVGGDGVGVQLHQHLEEPLPDLTHAYIL